MKWTYGSVRKFGICTSRNQRTKKHIPTVNYDDIAKSLEFARRLLVGGFNPSEKSVGIIIPNIWKNKINFPNHQPDYLTTSAQNHGTLLTQHGPRW